MKSRAVGRGVSEWLLLGRSVVAELSSAHFARRNVHRPGEEFTGWKSNPVKEKIALRAARKVVFVTARFSEVEGQRKMQRAEKPTLA